MKILTVDIGTGTQDIFLYNSMLDMENAYKMVLPSATMMINHQLHKATNSKLPVVLTGVTMGGGPSQWAATAHIKAGYPVYATPDAARSFNDDLSEVEKLGIKIISEDEAAAFKAEYVKIDMRDFDFHAIERAFNQFGISLSHLEAVAVAVFDHGAAPKGVSDRKFRFDYLDTCIRSNYRLTNFAYRSENIPKFMTRLQAVANSSQGLDSPLILMDTAPAAILGATFDPQVAECKDVILVNIGNLHTLAFHLGPKGIKGVFEHHTGLLDQKKLENLLWNLADGSLKNEDVYNDNGHGALIYNDEPFILPTTPFGIAVTGPRRNMMRGSFLHPYFPVPFGDMMLCGCFGLLAAAADLLPQHRDMIMHSLLPNVDWAKSPWDFDAE